MTTPTREQVVHAITEMDASAHLDTLQDYINNLEATVKEQSAEIDRLIIASADHVTVRSEQFQKISDQVGGD